MKTITMSTEKTFDAAHYLEFHEGKCKNMHGHTYKVMVEVEFPQKAIRGRPWVMDFAEFKAIIDEIINPLDHTCLNLKFGQPTAENISMHILNELIKQFDRKPREIRVHLWETPENKVTARWVNERK